MTLKKIDLIKLIYKINDAVRKETLWSKNDKINKNSIEEIATNLTDLQIHEFLYFIYGYYYQRFHKELFEANFFANIYGPIEKNYQDGMFNVFKNIVLSEQEEAYIKDIIYKLLRYSIYSLIEESQLTDPWKNNFNSKKINKIPTNEINKYFA